MAQGPRGVWQEPARWVTHFLSWASKKENAWQKKEDAKENLSGKVFSGRFPKTEGLRPLRLLRGFYFWCVLNRKVVQFSVTLSFWFVSALEFGSFTTIFVPSSKLSVLFRRSGNFSSRGLPMFMGAFPTSLQIPRKDFCRAKVPCGGRDSKLAIRQLDSQIPYQSSKVCQTTTRVLTVFASTLD